MGLAPGGVWSNIWAWVNRSPKERLLACAGVVVLIVLAAAVWVAITPDAPAPRDTDANAQADAGAPHSAGTRPPDSATTAPVDNYTELAEARHRL
jgi:hypothetical protein